MGNVAQAGIKSKYVIEVLLRYYYSPEDHPDMHEGDPGWRVAIRWLLDEDLLEHHSSSRKCYRVTPRGEAYVDAIWAIQLPIAVWVIPKQSDTK